MPPAKIRPDSANTKSPFESTIEHDDQEAHLREILNDLARRHHLEPLKYYKSGGLSLIYRSRQRNSGREVAVKLVRDMSGKGLRLLRRENSALQEIDHPNVIKIYGGDSHSLIMEFVDGPDLLEKLNNEIFFSVQETLHIGLQIAEAMQAVHVKGILHLDLKPSNVIFVNQSADNTSAQVGLVKVVDFGIAQFLPAFKGFVSQQSTINSKHPREFGTRPYRAPECWLVTEMDFNKLRYADTYSLGCLLFQLLSGQLPFCGFTERSLRIAHITDSCRPRLSETRANIPRDIELLLNFMMEKEPTKRPTMAEVARNIKSILAAYPTTSLRSSPFPGMLPYNKTHAYAYLTPLPEGVQTALGLMKTPSQIEPIDLLDSVAKQQRRWLQIVGPRYSGRTSFIHGGLLPLLAQGRILSILWHDEPRFLTIDFDFCLRTGADVITTLAVLLAKAMNEDRPFT